MKISNSKKALAKAIFNGNVSVGGWLGGRYACQQDDGEIWFANSKPKWQNGRGIFEAGYEDHITVGFLIINRHQTILSKDEYFHLYPVDDDGWIEWNGGERPVYDECLVDVKTRDGEIDCGDKAYYWNWSHSNTSCKKSRQIIAYRLHKPEVKPEFCESVTRSIPEPELDDAESRLTKAIELVKAAAPHMLSDKYKFDGDEVMGERNPSIEQLAADYRNKLDYANRKQQDADDAKSASDAALGDLEIAGDALGLAIMISNPTPELVIADWRDLQVGDVIKCVGGSWLDDVEGKEAVVSGLERKDYKFSRRIRVSLHGGSDWGADFEFIRRP